MPSRWKIPGGGVEVNETKEVTVVREYYDETGLRIKHFRHYKSLTKDSWDAKINQHIQHVYIAEIETLSGFLACAKDGEEKLTNGIFPVSDVLHAIMLRKKLAYNEVMTAHAKILKEVLLILFC